MRGKWLLTAVTAVLLAAAAGALSLLRRSNSPKTPEPGATVSATVDDSAEISFQGQVQARDVTPVAAPIEGTIDEFLAEVGDEVGEGQALARIHNESLVANQESARAEAERLQTRINAIESAILAARLEASRARADASRARAEYERAEKTYQRQQILQREGATARLTFEKAQKEFQQGEIEFKSLDELARQSESRVADLLNNLEAARRSLEEKNAELEAANGEMQAAEVHAPVDGAVVARHGMAGDEVNRSTILFQVATDASALEVVVEPDPAALARLRPGQTAVVLLAELPDQGIEGRVRKVGEDGRVLVEFTRPSPEVKPGLTAQVRIRVR